MKGESKREGGVTVRNQGHEEIQVLETEEMS